MKSWERGGRGVGEEAKKKKRLEEKKKNLVVNIHFETQRMILKRDQRSIRIGLMES